MRSDRYKRYASEEAERVLRRIFGEEPITVKPTERNALKLKIAFLTGAFIVGVAFGVYLASAYIAAEVAR
jgi:hypothetical protein